MNYSLTIKIILILLFIYLLIIFYDYTKQRSLLYVPQIDNYDDELLIIPAKQVFIENSSNIKLRSIFYKHPSNTKTTLLMFPVMLVLLKIDFIKLTSYQNITKTFYLFLGDHIAVMMANLLKMVYMMMLKVL